MSEKEIKKEIRKLKLEKWFITRLFAEVGSLIVAGFILLSSPGLNIFELIALIIVMLIWDAMMISMAYTVKGTPELIKEIDEEIEKLKKTKGVKEVGNEKIKKIEKNFFERLKKGEYKILLNEDGEIKFQKHETEEKVEPKKHETEEKVEPKKHETEEKVESKKHETEEKVEPKKHETEEKVESKKHETEEKVESKKHEVEEKVEPKKESILSELAWEYLSYNYGGTGLSKEELTNLKNDLLEKLNVLMNENNPETVESQLTNKEEVKVKKYTCNDIKE